MLSLSSSTTILPLLSDQKPHEKGNYYLFIHDNDKSESIGCKNDRRIGNENGNGNGNDHSTTDSINNCIKEEIIMESSLKEEKNKKNNKLNNNDNNNYNNNKEIMTKKRASFWKRNWCIIS